MLFKEGAHYIPGQGIDRSRCFTQELKYLVSYRVLIEPEYEMEILNPFDENWKGGAHPAEVEKHWGLYRADRSAKLAVRDASE